MKKRIISLMLIITTLLCSSVFGGIVFSDLSVKHWAFEYIYEAQRLNIINGYEDGTFKPENQLKTGEFIKMIAMAKYPDFKYESPAEGVHWAMPYVKSLNMSVLMARAYNNEKLEKIITRAEAAALVCKFHITYKKNEDTAKQLDNDEQYIKMFKDEATITNPVHRRYVNNCVKFGLINGFEDGTFRPEESLTRAQAAKIILKAMEE